MGLSREEIEAVLLLQPPYNEKCEGCKHSCFFVPLAKDPDDYWDTFSSLCFRHKAECIYEAVENEEDEEEEEEQE